MGLTILVPESKLKAAEAKAEKKAEKKMKAVLKTSAYEQAVATVQAVEAQFAKPSSKVETKDETTQRVDKLIDLHTKLQALGAFDMVKEFEQTKKELNAVARELGEDTKAYTFVSDKGEVTFSPCASTTEITDKAKLIELMGMDVFLQVAKVSMADCKNYLSAIELTKVTGKVSGPRKLQAVVPKA